MNEKVFVLDSSAFIMGYDPLSINEKQYTTPSVRDEVRGAHIIWLRFKMAFEKGKLELLQPSPKTLKVVEDSAKRTGDFDKLSKVDREVVALAEELRLNGLLPVIVSDDYSIQNVADHLQLEYASLSTIGIRHRFHWIKHCSACHLKYPPNTSLKTCTVCGAPIKRKPLKKGLASGKIK